MANADGKRFNRPANHPAMGKNNVKMMGVAAVVIVVCLLASWVYF